MRTKDEPVGLITAFAERKEDGPEFAGRRDGRWGYEICDSEVGQDDGGVGDDVSQRRGECRADEHRDEL